MSAVKFHNRTRQTFSIPEKLWKQGRWLEVPLYHLLRKSDLAREGLDNSGSYLFADHIYRGQPSGRGALGYILDWSLLRLPAVRSFRSRYLGARDALTDVLLHRSSWTATLHVVSAPCGLPREMAEAARAADRLKPGCLENVFFHGVDLSPDVLREATNFALLNKLPNFVAHQGDALNASSYPASVDFITSTGLAEFLDDTRLVELYRVFHEVLKPGGRLFTTGMRRLPLSDYLLELAELHTHYRTSQELQCLAEFSGFSEVVVRRDHLGIQSLMRAVR